MDLPRRCFRRLLGRPWATLAATVVVLGAAAAALPSLVTYTKPDAYTSREHPARRAIERLDSLFGISDERTIVVAVIDEGPAGVFDPATLRLVHWLTDRIRRLPGVDGERVKSLATEKHVVGTTDGMEIAPLLEAPPATREDADRVRAAALHHELLADAIVTRDARATAIVVKLRDERAGLPVYEAVRALVAEAPPNAAVVHIAGLGAYSALIGDYIDTDAARLNPLIAVVIVAMLAVAHRTVRGVVLPLLAAAAAVLAAFGAMAALGTPVYGITSSLSVILIAYGVADGIHILTRYYELVAAHPDRDARPLAVEVMVQLWRPLVFTSLTTLSGFLALAAASDMAPMRWYGVFASIGVVASVLASLLTIPAALALVRPRPSRAFGAAAAATGPGGGRLLRASAAFGRAVVRHPGRVLGLAAALGALAAAGALRVERDNEYHTYLNPWEPLYQAEVAINRTLGGIQSLNVIVEADEAGGLYRPEHLRRIEALQRAIESVPHVKTTKSLVDVVKHMHRAMHADDPARLAIPDSARLVAQYFLLYSMAGDGSDFDELVDANFRTANVWVPFDRSRWSDARRAVPAVEAAIAEHLAGSGLRASLAGEVHLGWHLDREIAQSQLLGVPLSFATVWLILAVAYGSVTAGALALVPMAFAMLVAWAVMGFAGIWLNFATAMTGTIAVGVGVDFAIHVVDHLIALVRVQRRTLEDAAAALFPTTGRALLFNTLAVLLGFGTLMLGSVPTVREFGLLVAVSIGAGFVASLTLLPALVAVVRPRFLAAPAPAPAPTEALGTASPAR
jgi:predicted RND superfamily exporter protein